MKLLALAALSACGSPEYGLASQEYGLAEPTDLAPTDDLGDGAAFAAWAAPERAGSPGFPLPVAGGRTASQGEASAPALLRTRGERVTDGTAAPERPAVRVEAFAVGPAPTPVADYLFVVDDSVSMRGVSDLFGAGIRSLTAPGVFPAGSLLAVMGTTPADPDDPTVPHPVMGARGADDLAPGFLGLVDAPRIAAYRAEAPPRYAKRFPLAGCGAWFAPGSTTPGGRPCLLAHTQNPLLPGRAEAGLVALRQWLERDDRPLFRAGAAVNVIFLSDTHDPGLSPERVDALGEDAQDLIALRPDFATLRALVHEPVAAFRVHAIAPESPCGEAWDAPTYFDVAADAGGVTADLCTTTDYAAVVGAIAKAGSVRQEPILRLGYDAADVLSVTDADGPVEWQPTDDPQAIALVGDLPDAMRRVQVRYRVAP